MRWGYSTIGVTVIAVVTVVPLTASTGLPATRRGRVDTAQTPATSTVLGGANVDPVPYLISSLNSFETAASRILLSAIQHADGSGAFSASMQAGQKVGKAEPASVPDF